MRIEDFLLVAGLSHAGEEDRKGSAVIPKGPGQVATGEALLGRFPSLPQKFPVNLPFILLRGFAQEDFVFGQLLDQVRLQGTLL